MGAGAVFLAILKAIPALIGLINRFVVWYVKHQIATFAKEDREGIRKAINEHDQIPLEESIGNPDAGKPTGLPGTTIVDRPPWLRP